MTSENLNKLLTTFSGSGPKLLYKKLPDGHYAEVVLAMNYEDFENQNILRTSEMEKMPQELEYDDRDNIIQIKIIDQESEKVYKRLMEYDDKDNLTKISSWILEDM